MRFIQTMVLALTLAGVGAVGLMPVNAQDDPIRVGSKLFAESRILAQIIMLALEDAGFQTQDLTPYGDTDAVREGLETNRLDIYVEYTGTAYENFFRDVEWFHFDQTIIHIDSLVYGVVSSLDSSLNDLIWLAPAPASNAHTIVLTRSFAQEHNLSTMSDFAAYINGGGDIRLAVTDTFVTRFDGLPSFEHTYDFTLEGGHLLVITNATTPVIQRAVSQGVNGINAGMSFTTDGGIQAHDLVMLIDDLEAQPVFQPTPVVRGELMREHPEIAGILNPLFLHIHEEDLQNLNIQVDVDGRDPRDVARDFLDELYAREAEAESLTEEYEESGDFSPEGGAVDVPEGAEDVEPGEETAAPAEAETQAPAPSATPDAEAVG